MIPIDNTKPYKICFNLGNHIFVTEVTDILSFKNDTDKLFNFIIERVCDALDISTLHETEVVSIRSKLQYVFSSIHKLIHSI